jgi:type I restriction enzyme S subunit
MGIETWNKKALKYLCHRIGDGLHGTPEYVEEGEIYFINGNNLKNGKIEITSDTKKVSSDVYETNYIGLDSNSLLLSINGTLGSMAFYNNENIMLGKSAAYLNFKTGINRFYYYYFQLENVQNCFYNLATGSTIKNLGLKSIQDFEVPIPDDREWKKIAKVLSDLDAKIELNNKINAELEAMAKLIYDYWFVQFNFPISKEQAEAMGKPELEGRGYKSSGGKMVWNAELRREVPEGWEVQTLSSWIKNDKSGDWGKEEMQGNYTERVFCIRGADLNGLNGKGEVKSPERYILEKNSHKILEPHDIIVEISGGSPTQSTGRMAYITNDSLKRFDAPIICSNFCKAVTLKDEKSLYNFAFEWNKAYDNGVLFGYEGKTSGIKNLLFESFVSSYLTTVPTKESMKQFYAFMTPLESRKQKNLLENQKLAELRDWLLPMLMNGQVVSTTINNHEREYQVKESEMHVAAEPRAELK